MQVPADANASSRSGPGIGEWREGGRERVVGNETRGKGPNLVGLMDQHKALGFSSGRERKPLEGLGRGSKRSDLCI